VLLVVAQQHRHTRRHALGSAKNGMPGWAGEMMAIGHRPSPIGHHQGGRSPQAEVQPVLSRGPTKVGGITGRTQGHGMARLASSPRSQIGLWMQVPRME